MGFELGSTNTSDFCYLSAIALAGLLRPNLLRFDSGWMAFSCSLVQVAAGLRRRER